MTNYEYCLKRVEQCRVNSLRPVWVKDGAGHWVRKFEEGFNSEAVRDFWENARVGFEKRICAMETEEGLAEHEVRQYENIRV